MFNLGLWELVIIFATILLLFGGKKLPEIATGLGAAIKNFKESLSEKKNEKSDQILLENKEKNKLTHKE